MDTSWTLQLENNWHYSHGLSSWQIIGPPVMNIPWILQSEDSCHSSNGHITNSPVGSPVIDSPVGRYLYHQPILLYTDDSVHNHGPNTTIYSRPLRTL
ncbi:hypothetical protein CEXT_773351 [Caerostris extrusa]|uniref:Uncharacterized protein n=1 Tax=Caerostris extrusa TaxID=172846 RepID=A0AAV4YCT4_CAEEX|nr:hypothetical protein CEXT_773351 [Caerostris extrusa]